MSVTIIAEAGVNHDGNLNKALEMVDIAANSGADIIKFQTFTASTLACQVAPKANYQLKTTPNQETQIDMLKRLELPRSWHRKIIKQCNKNNIQFLSTPFDIESLNFLTNELNIPVIKIPSGEITNAPLLLTAAQSRRKLIVSTGMCNLNDIQNALDVIAFGLIYPNTNPDKHQIDSIRLHAKTNELLQQYVTLLHCNTQYPTPAKDANLKAMATMRDAFNLPVGYSDHTNGIVVSIAATALGATVIEKHFTLDKTSPGPDHAASIEPDELTTLVNGIRTCTDALGNGKKQIQPSEEENILIARKSLVALTDINYGDVFSRHNLGAKRPGGGRSPMDYFNLIGQKAERNYKKDELI